MQASTHTPSSELSLGSRDFEGTLDDPKMLALRQGLIFSIHVEALNKWVETAAAPGKHLPYFDPLDGGARATILILLEAPARQAMRPRFVSRDNPGPSQRNLKKFLLSAGLNREETVIWNIVPWLPPGDRKAVRPRIVDVRRGTALLLEVLELLPNLRGIILSGRTAQYAQTTLKQRRPDLFQVQMPHPSPLSVCSGDDVAGRIVSALQSAKSQSR